MKGEKKLGEKKVLVIVESPSKAKTINKYLGSHYFVTSSKGHLIDLPKSRMAIDIENNFLPEYKVVHGRAKDLKALKKEAGKSTKVLLATDPDREGEAISWHLNRALSEINKKIYRITFNEITKTAIKEAVANLHEIDQSLVDAQQARRVLDRLVGYTLSPLLWKKVKAGLSAGRVQSVSLRLIVEREELIDAFIPEEYWSLFFKVRKGKYEYLAKLLKYQDKKIETIHTKAQAESIIAAIEKSELKVFTVNEKITKRRPLAPYTTSKLQQDGLNRLGFTARKTMSVAQKLYEGINLKKVGLVGLITYMRTDSTRISPQAIESVRQFIESEYGIDYLPEKPNIYKSGKKAQDAHEGIRPTSVQLTPEDVRASLDRSGYRLYKMIWERFVASQMSDAKFKNTNILIKAGEYSLSVNGSKVHFDGYNKVFSSTSKGTIVKGIDKLTEGDILDYIDSEPEQKFTQPLPRFSEATLIKTLEELGIGRPSTYAPTIATLTSRYYVTKTGRQLVPTELGKIVNKLLVDNFPDILNVNFTVQLEENLDRIADGKKEWVETVREFYTPFNESMKKALVNIEKINYKLEEATDFVCEKCGKPMVKKLGRYGYFLACSGFPECHNVRPVPLGKCPKEGCEGDIVAKKGKRGRPFFGCTSYPDCDFVTYKKILSKPCPKCGKILVEDKNDKEKIAKCLNDSCGYEEPLKE